MSGPALQTRPLLRCEPEYGALVCLKCNNGFPRGKIVRHLNSIHHITVDVYLPALRPFEHIPLAKDWADLRHPPNQSAPIEELKVRHGFACTKCGHLTRSKRAAKEHLNKCGEVRQVHLQCWNLSAEPTYWIVTPPPPTSNGNQQAGSFTLQSTLYNDIGPSLQDIAIEKVLQRECELDEEEESRRVESNGKCKEHRGNARSFS